MGKEENKIEYRQRLSKENKKLREENVKLLNRLARPSNRLKEGMHILGYIQLKEQYAESQRVIERYHKAFSCLDHGVRCPQCTSLIKIRI